MNRLPNWETRYYAVLEAWRDRPYADGTSDCCTFAGDVIHALTGEDPYAPYRGQYRTVEEGLTLLRQHGHRDLYSCLRSLFGRPVRPMLAGRGDLILRRTDTGPALGICDGGAWFVGEHGIICLPLDEGGLVFHV